VKFKDLLPQEQLVLYAASQLWGRTWKSPLARCWQGGLYPEQLNGPILQSLRNKIGPSGLYRLGKMSPPKTHADSLAGELEMQPAIFKISCGFCGMEQDVESDSSKQVAQILLAQGWRVATSEYWGVIDHACPDCLNNKRNPRSDGYDSEYADLEVDQGYL
jgi:hypothetical protein